MAILSTKALRPFADTAKLQSVGAFLRSQCGSLRESFKFFDKQGLGSVSAEAFAEGLRNLGCAEDPDQIFCALDRDHVGLITLRAFLLGLEPRGGDQDDVMTSTVGSIASLINSTEAVRNDVASTTSLASSYEAHAGSRMVSLPTRLKDVEDEVTEARRLREEMHEKLARQIDDLGVHVAEQIDSLRQALADECSARRIESKVVLESLEVMDVSRQTENAARQTETLCNSTIEELKAKLEALRIRLELRLDACETTQPVVVAGAGEELATSNKLDTVFSHLASIEERAQAADAERRHESSEIRNIIDKTAASLKALQAADVERRQESSEIRSTIDQTAASLKSLQAADMERRHESSEIRNTMDKTAANLQVLQAAEMERQQQNSEMRNSLDHTAADLKTLQQAAQETLTGRHMGELQSIVDERVVATCTSVQDSMGARCDSMETEWRRKVEVLTSKADAFARALDGLAQCVDALKTENSEAARRIGDVEAKFAVLHSEVSSAPKNGSPRQSAAEKKAFIEEEMRRCLENDQILQGLWRCVGGEFERSVVKKVVAETKEEASNVIAEHMKVFRESTASTTPTTTFNDSEAIIAANAELRADMKDEVCAMIAAQMKLYREEDAVVASSVADKHRVANASLRTELMEEAHTIIAEQMKVHREETAKGTSSGSEKLLAANASLRAELDALSNRLQGHAEALSDPDISGVRTRLEALQLQVQSATSQSSDAVRHNEFQQQQLSAVQLQLAKLLDQMEVQGQDFDELRQRANTEFARQSSLMAAVLKVARIQEKAEAHGLVLKMEEEASQNGSSPKSRLHRSLHGSTEAASYPTLTWRVLARRDAQAAAAEEPVRLNSEDTLDRTPKALGSSLDFTAPMGISSDAGSPPRKALVPQPSTPRFPSQPRGMMRVRSASLNRNSNEQVVQTHAPRGSVNPGATSRARSASLRSPNDSSPVKVWGSQTLPGTAAYPASGSRLASDCERRSPSAHERRAPSADRKRGLEDQPMGEVLTAISAMRTEIQRLHTADKYFHEAVQARNHSSSETPNLPFSHSVRSLPGDMHRSSHQSPASLGAQPGQSLSMLGGIDRSPASVTGNSPAGNPPVGNLPTGSLPAGSFPSVSPSGRFLQQR